MDLGQFKRLSKTFLFVGNRGTLGLFFDAPCTNLPTHLLTYLLTQLVACINNVPTL